MVCTKCRYEMADTFSFCPMCGKSVAKQEKKRRRRANGEGPYTSEVAHIPRA